MNIITIVFMYLVAAHLHILRRQKKMRGKLASTGRNHLTATYRVCRAAISTRRSQYLIQRSNGENLRKFLLVVSTTVARPSGDI